MRDQELILRFLALLFEGQNYKKPMVSFLNEFMGHNKKISGETASLMRNSFVTTIDLILNSVGDRAFRPVRALNAAVFDAVMVGTAKRLRDGAIAELKMYKDAYDRLLSNKEFLDACGRGTASEERVRARLRLASEAFAPVP